MRLKSSSALSSGKAFFTAYYGSCRLLKPQKAKGENMRTLLSLC